jgi:hypothetical protein
VRRDDLPHLRPGGAVVRRPRRSQVVHAPGRRRSRGDALERSTYSSHPPIDKKRELRAAETALRPRRLTRIECRAMPCVAHRPFDQKKPRRPQRRREQMILFVFCVSVVWGFLLRPCGHRSCSVNPHRGLGGEAAQAPAYPPGRSRTKLLDIKAGAKARRAGAS